MYLPLSRTFLDDPITCEALREPVLLPCCYNTVSKITFAMLSYRCPYCRVWLDRRIPPAPNRWAAAVIEDVAANSAKALGAASSAACTSQAPCGPSASMENAAFDGYRLRRFGHLFVTGDPRAWHEATLLPAIVCRAADAARLLLPSAHTRSATEAGSSQRSCFRRFSTCCFLAKLFVQSVTMSAYKCVAYARRLELGGANDEVSLAALLPPPFGESTNNVASSSAAASSSSAAAASSSSSSSAAASSPSSSALAAAASSSSSPAPSSQGASLSLNAAPPVYVSLNGVQLFLGIALALCAFAFLRGLDWYASWYACPSPLADFVYGCGHGAASSSTVAASSDSGTIAFGNGDGESLQLTAGQSPGSPVTFPHAAVDPNGGVLANAADGLLSKLSRLFSFDPTWAFGGTGSAAPNAARAFSVSADAAPPLSGSATAAGAASSYFRHLLSGLGSTLLSIAHASFGWSQHARELARHVRLIVVTLVHLEDALFSLSFKILPPILFSITSSVSWALFTFAFRFLYNIIFLPLSLALPPALLLLGVRQLLRSCCVPPNAANTYSTVNLDAFDLLLQRLFVAFNSCCIFLAPELCFFSGCLSGFCVVILRGEPIRSEPMFAPLRPLFPALSFRVFSRLFALLLFLATWAFLHVLLSHF